MRVARPCIRQLSVTSSRSWSVVITRSTPGPAALYIVSVDYFVAGVPGALAGWLAIVTPASLIIPLVHYRGMAAGS